MYRSLRGLGRAAALSATMLVAGNASALVSVEGATLGDQGYYWHTGAEAWIFPHRIGNVDNRGMLQFESGGQVNTVGAATFQALASGSGTGGGLFYNMLAEQAADGGGIIIELADNFNLGVWISEYAGPGLGSFVEQGIARTGWGTFVGGVAGANDLNDLGLDPVPGTLNTFDAGRKVDLFLSYWIPSAKLETGLRLYWGSNQNRFQFDDSIGPVNIDEESNPTDVNALQNSESLAVAESVFRLTDFGLGLGAGWSGIDALRIDFGFNLNILGVTWEPNGISNYVDAGGTGIGLNLRGAYKLSNRWQIGLFGRWSMQSGSFEPLRQRDGGDLIPFDTASRSDSTNAARWGGTLGNPTGTPGNADFPDGDPTLVTNEFQPVQGITYQQWLTDFQVAALVQFDPVSRATIQASVGIGQVAASRKTSVGEDWLTEDKLSLLATPFIQLAVTGRVFDWLDIYAGASRRWQDFKQTAHHFDSRIPDDGSAPGPSGTPAPPAGSGVEDGTNANRRDIETSEARDESHTRLMLGTRLHYNGVQIVAQLDHAVLNRGPYFLFGGNAGGSDPIGLWVGLIYDWDDDVDGDSGNGQLVRISPHGAEKAPAKAPAEEAPAAAPAAEESEEVLDG